MSTPPRPADRSPAAAPAQPDPTLTPGPLRRGARTAYAVNALVAWVAVLLTVVISAADGYDRGPVDPGLYGDTARGAAGLLPRVVDTLSYFTIWSNIAVAVSVTVLWLAPHRSTPLRRVLRLTGVLMIIVTGIVYQLLLAPTADVTGWSLLTNPLLHVVVPILTVAVWLLWGPRGATSWATVLGSLTVPAAWIAWALGRGAVIDAYPYGFVNVAERGVGPVALTIGQILVFGVVVGALLHLLDLGLRRVAGSRS